MLNVAYTRYVNTLITIAVISLSACTVQRTSSETLPPHHPDATRSFYSPRKSNFRNRRDSLALTCDPVGWVDYTNPKFECGVRHRWDTTKDVAGVAIERPGIATEQAMPPSSESDTEAAKKYPNSSNSEQLTENRICIPLSSRCDFIADCPDGSDEFNCYATRCESEHDFLCESDLTCIPREALCDGRFDCCDRSDELSPHLYCNLKTIGECGPQSGLIPCDGRCLPNENICDGHQHCSSGLDESYVVCRYGNFFKNSRNDYPLPSCGLKHFECWEPVQTLSDVEETLEKPQCIDYEHVCDGKYDCSDASDEKFCEADEIKACDGFALLKNCAADNKRSLCKYPNGGKHVESDFDEGALCPFELCPTDDQGSYSLEGCNPLCTVPTDRVCRWQPFDSNTRSPYYKLGMTSFTPEKSLECVHFEAFCNSSVECSNEADEILCGILECDDPSQFHCGGVAGQCIDSLQRCDGFADCWNGSDESGCTHKEQHCTSTQFFCPYQSSNEYNAAAGRCVELQDACYDNLVSCYNNIHLQICQRLCSNNPGFCPQNAQCQDSKSGPTCKCMASGYVYDYSNRQCVDFDECNANVTKYAIPCDQKCTNTEGSFVCSCYPGYILDSSDNSTCVAEDQSAFMLVTDLHLSVIDLRPVMTHGTKSSESSRQLALSSVDTNRRDGAGTQSQSQTARKRGGGGGGSPSYAKHFLNISYPPSAVKQNRYISFAAFDYRLRMIYFADRYSNCIYKVKLPSWNLSDLDSSTLLNNTSVFVNGSSGNDVDKSLISEGMAVDYSSGNLYWIEREPFTQIHVISSDAKHAVSLVTQNLSQPREISLHTPKRLLFWVDWGTDSIERCNFDGTERQIVLANERIDFINSIHVDEFSDYIYFLDAKHDAIEFVRMDGTNRGYLLKGQSPVVVRPFSITMFENTVYWSDWGFGAIPRNIHKCNKLKCHSDKSELNGTYYGSMHLTVIHKTMQDLQRVPSYSCLTNNGDCGEENFCLPLPSNPADLGRTHACYRPVILTVPANTTTNTSDADFISTDKEFEESKEKNEIAKCKSQSENCLPATRMSAQLLRHSKDENFIQYICYCGPLSEKIPGNFSEGLPKWLWGILAVLIVIMVTFIIVIGVLYFCCVRESPRGIVLLAEHKKVSKIENLSDGRSNTMYGNPVLNSQGFVNGVGTSPHPSPACEAIEMGQYFTFDNPKINGVCSTGGGGGVKEGGQSRRNLSDFQAQQPQSAHVVVSQRTPSFGQSPVLQSIPEEGSESEEDGEEDEVKNEREVEEKTIDEDGQEDRTETFIEDGNQYMNSSVCYSKIPRNYSLGGSSTTALMYYSDDEVFTFDNDENLACSKV